MSKIARIYQGLEEIQKYYQGGVLQRLFFDWKHYIGNELNIEYAKECTGRNVVISGKTYQNLFDMKNLNYDYYDTLTDDGYKNINIPELSTGYKVCKSAVNNLIKANTVYTIIIDVRINTFNKNFGINSDYNNEGYFSKNIAIKQNFIGRMIVTATSKETLPSNSQKVFRTQITPDSLGELEFKLMLLEGDYTNTDLPTSIDGIESVAERERNLANYIIDAIGTLGEKVVFDNKNCLKITSTFSRTIVLNGTSDYLIYVNAYANNENNKAYSIGNFGGTYIGCGNKTWQGFKMTKSLNKFSIYNYQNSEVYIDLDTLSLVRVNNPYPLKLNARGKNLFNPNNLEYGNMNKDTGKNLADVTSMKRTINYISVKSETPYIINSSCRVFEYDKDKSFLSSTAMAGRFITSKNTEYIKFHGNTTKEFVDDKKIQLEEGTVATPYEPYREPIITTLNLPIPLRSLPNGVCDTIEGNRLIQRVGKVVLDGSSNFGDIQFSALSDNNARILIKINNFKRATNPTMSGISNMLTHDANYSINGKEHFYIAGNVIWIFLNTSRLETLDSNGLINFLQSNPITIYYPLATPIETEITPNMILIDGESITDTVGIELPDGTKDSIENDYYVKRVGKVIINGKNGTYQRSGTSTSTLDVYVVRKLDINITLKGLNTNYIYQCDSEIDMSKYITVGKWLDDSTSGSIVFKIPTEEYLWSDIFNAFLENPITLYVELATPVKIPLFSIKEGLTTLKSTNNITPQMELDCLVRDNFQNLCDNEWEMGDINLDTGVNEDSTNRIRLVNDIQVKSNTTYRIDTVSLMNLTTNNANVGVRYYNISKTYISGGLIGDIKSSTYTFTTPENCYYIRFIVETTDINFKIYLKEVF